MNFDWNDIPILLALARSGSMSAAARELGVDASTISRRLVAAEAALQTRLFIRDNVRYNPTAAGQFFLERADTVVGHVQSMLLDTHCESENVVGVVRLTSIDFLINYWLVERLPNLLDANPQLTLQLLVANQALSFTRREADFALRLARPQEDAALLMRKVGELGFAVYGAPRFAGLQREDWAAEPWLAYGKELAEMEEMKWLTQIAPAGTRLIEVSSVTTLVRACEAGLGLALLPCFMADRHGLVRLSDAPEMHREVWLLSHRDLGKIGRYRAVGDWLTEQFDADQSRLHG